MFILPNTESPFGSRVLGVIWNDKLTLNMFLDFLKKVYLKDRKLEILSYTLMNSSEGSFEPDIVMQTLNQIDKIPEDRIIFVAIKAPKVLNLDNQVLLSTVKQLPLVVYVPANTPQSVHVLKGNDSLTEILKRWETNIIRISGVST